MCPATREQFPAVCGFVAELCGRCACQYYHYYQHCTIIIIMKNIITISTISIIIGIIIVISMLIAIELHPR